MQEAGRGCECKVVGRYRSSCMATRHRIMTRESGCRVTLRLPGAVPSRNERAEGGGGGGCFISSQRGRHKGFRFEDKCKKGRTGV